MNSVINPSNNDASNSDLHQDWSSALIALTCGCHARRDNWRTDPNLPHPFLFLEMGQCDHAGKYAVRIGHKIPGPGGLSLQLFEQGAVEKLPKIWHQAGDVCTPWQPSMEDIMAHDWRIMEL